MSTQEVLPEVMGVIYHCQELTMDHTVIPLWLRQGPASIGDHSFTAILVLLRQHGPNATVTGISVQDEWLAVVRES